MWSKDGRFVEFMHTVVDIITNISANCVINFHVSYYLRVYFYGFILCVVINIFIFMGIVCICLPLFQCESVHLQNVFVYLHFIYKASARVLCVYMF